MQSQQTERVLVYVGTYTRGSGVGLYAYELDDETGRLRHAQGVMTENPSFVAYSRLRSCLYAVNETTTYRGKPGGGAVTAYRVHPKSGTLTRINQRSSQGPSPCHVAVDATGRCVVAANYGDGSIVTFQIAEDGGLEEATQVVQHEGGGPNPRRQQGPHAHSVTIDPTNRFVYAADLGTDKIMIYELAPSAARLTPHDRSFVAMRPGAGPRHFCFHPNGRFAYVINELDSTVTVFRWYRSSGGLEELQVVSTLPTGVNEENTGADLHIHPNGRLLYASNRGHDSLAAFAVWDEGARLEPITYLPTGGKTPRGFAISPSGRWLMAANQDSDGINVFRVHDLSGMLEPVGERVRVARPVCLLPVTFARS